MGYSNRGHNDDCDVTSVSSYEEWACLFDRRNIRMGCWISSFQRPVRQLAKIQSCASRRRAFRSDKPVKVASNLRQRRTDSVEDEGSSCMSKRDL